MISRAYQEEEKAQRLRKRLWGAAVLIALAVVVLPMILDGAGSESQQRAVEKLAEAPAPRELKVPKLARAIPSPEPTDTTSDAATDTTTATPAPEPSATSASDPISIWVVQAGAFNGEDNALQLRDKLRSAGFASFVQSRKADTEPFLVLVGPMIKQQSANKARDEVAVLLQNEPVVSIYQ